MMLFRMARLLLIVLVATALTACGTSPSRFYRLDSAATPNGAPSVQTVGDGRTSIGARRGGSARVRSSGRAQPRRG